MCMSHHPIIPSTAATAGSWLNRIGFFENLYRKASVLHINYKWLQGFPLFFPSTNPMNQPLWHSLASEMSVSRNRLLRTKAVSMAPGVLFTIGPAVLQHLQRSTKKTMKIPENPKKPVTSHDVWSPIPGLKLGFTYTLIIRLMRAMWSGLASLWFINHHESHPHQHPPTLFTPPPSCLRLILCIKPRCSSSWRCNSKFSLPRGDKRGFRCGFRITVASLAASCQPVGLSHPSQNSNGSPKEKASSLESSGIYPPMDFPRQYHESTSILILVQVREKKKGVFLERPRGAHHAHHLLAVMVQKNHGVPKCLFPHDIPWSRYIIYDIYIY